MYERSRCRHVRPQKTSSAAAHRGLRATQPELSSNTQPIDNVVIPVYVTPLQIIEQTSPLAHHLQQPASRVIVLNVCSEVERKLVDPLRENCYLNFGRPCIGIMNLVIADDISLCLFR